ncbi:MAG: sensor histidine kinase, partial [Syntrophales bacterium]
AILFRGGSFHLYRSQWLTGCFFVAGAMLWSVRFLERFIYQTQFWGPSIVLTALLMLGFGIVVLTSFGFMLMIRERAGKALREGEERYRFLVQNAPTGICELDYTTGRFLEVNDVMCLMLGYTRDEFLAMTAFDILDDDGRALFASRIRLGRSGEQPDEAIEYRVWTKDGRFMWVLVNLRFHWIDGKVTKAMAVAHDITERKKAEQALVERTAKLEEINKELESFSYSVSHDLRAPLRAIDGYARLILKRQGDKFDADTLDKFNVIRSSTHLMGQLIDDLLTFSRLGRKEISLALLDMDLLMKDAWKEVHTSEPERKIKLTVESMPPCYGDRALIKQVLINLLSNADKFTKYKDAAKIVVGGHTDGNESVYYVKDNGVGFDMAYYDKLFGVFQRLHSTEQFEGTGVGLATVQRIIRRHNGRVWAEGKVDEGATFYFSLPSSHTHNGWVTAL